jgi:glucose/arabinose dehydrogenase
VARDKNDPWGMDMKYDCTAVRAVAAGLAALVIGWPGATAARGPSGPRAAGPRAAQSGGPVTVSLQALVPGLVRPVYATGAGDGSGRLFIVEKRGIVSIYDTDTGQHLPTPFLDITSKVGPNSGNEQGLLSIAFDPNYSTNRRFFVFYTRAQDGALTIARYVTPANSPNQASAASEVIILTIPHPNQTNHNGGQLQFGPDGFLYVGTGDGGGQNDPNGNGQNKNALLGKILRIDVSGDGYTSPPDNPFAGATAGADQIFAYGFRNPWRFSFDRQTGQLWAGDVGQNQYEEIDVVTKGGNYGWNVMEGTHCFSPSTGCNMTGLQLPVYEYSHSADPCEPGSGGRCSVTGGYVYRGSSSPALVGTYFFADYCGSTIYGLKNGEATCLFNGADAQAIASFGQDDDGEVYILTDSTFGGRGTLCRIVGPAGGCAVTCPEDLSVVDADGSGSEVVTYQVPTGAGDCGTVTCVPAPATTFQVGTTTVTCTAERGDTPCSFTVTVRPPGLSVVSCTPSSGAKKQTLEVTIAGGGFEPGATVSFGQKIQVLETTVVSPEEIRVEIKIKKKAKRGPRDVVVSNPGGATATGDEVFTVT